MAELIYYGGKLLWVFAEPMHLLLLWLAVGTAFLFSLREQRRKRGRKVVFIGVIVACLIAIFPVGQWGMAMLENRFPQPQLPPKVAGIIMIGGNEDESIATARGAQWSGFGTMGRELGFKILAQKYPDAMLIFSGGAHDVDSPSAIRQADIAKVILETMGLQRPVAYERDSRTTYENALFSAKIAGDKIKGPWILVTSAWHMPRAVGAFRSVGWKVIPMPVDYGTAGKGLPLFQLSFYTNMAELHGFTRESLGMFCYWLVGHSDALFPGPK